MPGVKSNGQHAEFLLKETSNVKCFPSDAKGKVPSRHQRFLMLMIAPADEQERSEREKDLVLMAALNSQKFLNHILLDPP